MDPLRVLIVDDHPAVRAGVRSLLAAQRGIELLADAGTADAALAALPTLSPPPDVAVVDYHLGQRNGLWLTLQLRGRQLQPRILIYSAFADGALAAAAIVAGADGVLPKSSIATELARAVRQIGRGGTYLPVISRTLALSIGACLADRERAVLELMLLGIGPAEVATRLEITADEVESRRRAILARLAPAATRTQTSTIARRPLEYRDGPDGPSRRSRPRATR